MFGINIQSGSKFHHSKFRTECGIFTFGIKTLSGIRTLKNEKILINECSCMGRIMLSLTLFPECRVTSSVCGT